MPPCLYRPAQRRSSSWPAAPRPRGKQSRIQEREMRVYCRKGVWSRPGLYTHRAGHLWAPPPPPHLLWEGGPRPLPQFRHKPQSSLPPQFLPVWQTRSHPSWHRALPHLSPKKAAPTTSIAEQLHTGATSSPSRGAGAAAPSQQHQNPQFPLLPPQWHHQLQGPAVAATLTARQWGGEQGLKLLLTRH